MKQSKCIIVKAKDTSNILKTLKLEHILNQNLKLKKVKDKVIIPVIKAVSGFELYEDVFEERVIQKTYKALVNIPDNLKKSLPTSFDIVGDIAIIKLMPDLALYKTQIAKAIITTYKHINKVALDFGVMGEFRVRSLHIIIGESLETVHRENNIRLKMNLATVYFSPRLARERAVIARYVKDNETVLDMFCGIGPFSILIAKTHRGVKIYAVDKNPEAIAYLKENIKLNKVDGIIPILGDAKELIHTVPPVDHVIMNNPHHAMNFIKSALHIAKKSIYLYLITTVEEQQSIITYVLSLSPALLYKVRKVHEYSPTQALYCFELYK